MVSVVFGGGGGGVNGLYPVLIRVSGIQSHYIFIVLAIIGETWSGSGQNNRD